MKIQPHKLISIAFLGLVLGLQIHHTHVKWHRLGRPAYLAHETFLFDTQMANPKSPIAMILVAILMVGLLIGLYELVALGFSKLMPGTETSRTPTGFPFTS